MTPLPPGTLLVRTHFGNEDSWERLKAAVSTPNEDDFLAVSTTDSGIRCQVVPACR